MISKDDLEALISRVAMGDRGAFRALYAATSAKLFGIAKRILHDDGHAEEVLQVVYLRIWADAGLSRARGYAPMTWLITVTRNAAVDRLRRLRAVGDGPVSVGITDRLYDATPRPEAKSVDRDEARLLQSCLLELPSDRADMMRKAYLDGRSYAELTGSTDTSPKTLRLWLQHSLLQLRDCLSR